MAESESARFSRLCPSCGRRVVRRVTTCRCGATLPPEPEGEAAGEPEGKAATSSFRAAATFGAALIVTIGFGAYWLSRPAPADQPAAQSAGSRDATAAGNSPAGATTPAANRTAAEREWEAAVKLGASPTTPPPTPPTGAATPSTALPAAPTQPLSLEDIVSRAMPAVVLVETPSGRGSGFFVTADTLLTNVHVVENNSVVTLRRGDGTSVSARIESRAPAFDIAVLKVLSTSPGQATIPLGNAAGLRQGQELIVIGSPLGLLQNTVTRGIVSALRRSGDATLVQTDAAINPGNSGGPVLDRTGAAVGITTMSFRESQGLNFAVSIDHARSILEGHAPASTTTMSNAASGLRNFSPTVGSEADRARAEGLRELESKLDDIARAAVEFDAAWRRFKDECYSGAIRGSFDREWFAVFVPGAMAGTVSPLCGSYFTGFQRDANKFQAEMRSADEAARRAGVYPGEIRDARRTRRLDFAGWDR